MGQNTDFPERLLARLHEYDKSRVNLEEFKWVIIERVFESGTLEEARWLFSNYERKDFVHFLEHQGKRRLSHKNLSFWSRYFNLPIPPKVTNPFWDR